MTPKRRIGILLIAISTLVFLVSLGLFCIALGLDFENEGWGNGGGNRNVSQMIVASLGFTLSIVLFFVGVQKVSHPEA